MKYQVTRTYNANTDVIKIFDDIKSATEFYLELKTGATNVRIDLEEIK